MTWRQEIRKLSWNGNMPALEAHKVDIPEEIASLGMEGIAEGERLSEKAFKNRASGDAFKTISGWAKKFRTKMDQAPGFVLLNTAGEAVNDHQLTALYYMIAHGFGNLNTRYGELFEVKDRQLDYTKQAIPVSKTKASTGFHTDSTAKEYSPKVVGLLCLRPALKGGISLLANAADLFEWLNKNHPESIAPLSQPIIRDVITPGSDTHTEAIRKNQFPVFSFEYKEFKFRYMRYWITTGYERSLTVIPEELDDALNRIEEYFNADENTTRYKMKRGDMLFINNNFLCHNRTSYTDTPGVPNKRTLIRTWINP